MTIRQALAPLGQVYYCWEFLAASVVQKLSVAEVVERKLFVVASGLWLLQAASVVQKLSDAEVVERKLFVVASGLWLL